MRTILVLALGVAGCSALDPAPVTKCESLIKSKLRSPSTYKRIAVTSADMPAEKPPHHAVIIEYDAANAYGTPIRDKQICQFALTKNGVDVENYVDFDEQIADQLEAEADNLELAAQNLAGYSD